MAVPVVTHTPVVPALVALALLLRCSRYLKMISFCAVGFAVYGVGAVLYEAWISRRLVRADGPCFISRRHWGNSSPNC